MTHALVGPVPRQSEIGRQSQVSHFVSVDGISVGPEANRGVRARPGATTGYTGPSTPARPTNCASITQDPGPGLPDTGDGEASVLVRTGCL